MNTRHRIDVVGPGHRYPCGECGQMVGPGVEYHPYLYCVLWKAGIREQEKFLRASGWAPSGTSEETES